MKTAHGQWAVVGGLGKYTGLGVHSLPNTEIIKKHLAELSSSNFMTSFSSSQVTNRPGTGFCLRCEARV